jgi:hypothetical protein
MAHIAAFLATGLPMIATSFKGTRKFDSNVGNDRQVDVDR